MSAPGGLNLVLQREIFEIILDDLVSRGDLTNQLLEVELNKNGKVELLRADLPKA